MKYGKLSIWKREKVERDWKFLAVKTRILKFEGNKEKGRSRRNLYFQ